MEIGRGYSVGNWKTFRLFYLAYPDLIPETPSRELGHVKIPETQSRIPIRTQRKYPPSRREFLTVLRFSTHRVENFGKFRW